VFLRRAERAPGHLYAAEATIRINRLACATILRAAALIAIRLHQAEEGGRNLWNCATARDAPHKVRVEERDALPHSTGF
jgi:hypothetical protein